MSNAISSQINISANFLGTINKITEDVDKMADSVKKSTSKIDFSSVISQIEKITGAFAGLSAPGIGFEQAMADLSSVTGIVGPDLEKLGKTARQTGKESGLGATQAAKAFAMLASQIDVSKIGVDGLELLQQKSITLAQATGMSVENAANSLAGTINQFGLTATDAGRVINVLAAGSKYGSAEISDLALSFKAVGSAANAAGLTVEDTAGAIEVLSENNIKGAEAGTILSSIMTRMQTTMGVDFGETSLSQALDAMKPKLTDAAYLSQVFGEENLAAAQFLITNSGAVKEMTGRVTDTNVAQEKAAIRTQTTASKMDQWRASIDNVKIGFFELTGPMGGYITVMSEQMGLISQMLPLITSVGNGISWLADKENLKTVATGLSSAATAVWTGIQWAFNAAMTANPLVWVIALVVALVAAIVVCATKVSGWGKQWDSIVKFMKAVWELFCETFKFRWMLLVNGIMIGLDHIKLGWYKFKEACGLGDSAENQAAIASINDNIAARQKAIVDGAEKIAGLAKTAANSLTWELAWKSATEEAEAQSAPGSLPGTSPGALPGMTPMSGSMFTESSLTVDPTARIQTPATPAMPAAETVFGGASKPAGLTSMMQMPATPVAPAIPAAPVETTVTDMVEKNGYKQNLAGRSGSGGNSSTTIDLNQITPVASKGSTTYSAISSKLASIKMPSIATAAASLAMPLAVAGMTMSETSLSADALMDTNPSTQFDEQNFNDQSRFVKPEKFCDQIVINIASADGKGYDQVRGEIVNVLQEIMNDYEA